MLQKFNNSWILSERKGEIFVNTIDKETEHLGDNGKNQVENNVGGGKRGEECGDDDWSVQKEEEKKIFDGVFKVFAHFN